MSAADRISATKLDADGFPTGSRVYVDLDAPSPADGPAARRREQTIQQVAAALPARFTLDYCPEWGQRIAVVAAVLDAKAAVEAAFGGDSE